MVGRVDVELGGIDLVVNCAGLAVALPLEQLDATVWQSVIDVNLSGTFYVAREAALRMVAGRGGVTITIGSEMSVMGMETLSAYCAAKAGIIGLTKALAAELAPHVRVNAVCPAPPTRRC
jgi:NAD(P)-dependent dehydrogenase (short-subunit alcohol dehydrogenase family)